jgi:glucose-6-phosphate 1-dehydrogenase
MAAAKIDVFRSLAPLDPGRVVRGQYAGYRDLPDVATDSDTETLVALETRIDNRRWEGVPIFLRHGKRMAEGRRVVTVVLREPSMSMFEEHLGAGRSTRRDELVFEIGDPGGITINFQSKEPGASMLLGPAQLKFDYKSNFDPRCELEAYQRLLHDAMEGDQTLFTRARGIERLWEVADPLLVAPPPVERYEPGTWGPPSVDALITPNVWHLPDGRSSGT